MSSVPRKHYKGQQTWLHVHGAAESSVGGKWFQVLLNLNKGGALSLTWPKHVWLCSLFYSYSPFVSCLLWQRGQRFRGWIRPLQKRRGGWKSLRKSLRETTSTMKSCSGRTRRDLWRPEHCRYCLHFLSSFSFSPKTWVVSLMVVLSLLSVLNRKPNPNRRRMWRSRNWLMK